ncbi:hypothetical protein RUM44_012346 [Polyplax serrata]|uniref:Striatin N-terminal domain-containing protein n=1 Tax=Polyplax serrata TaxID=468196 RepID=A0ABR1BEW6_POLSC
MKVPNLLCGPTMEENSPSTNHNGQIGPGSGGANVGGKPNDDGNQGPQYSIPGILHFIQHEWARFEMERSQWEVDRAELQARIAFLQGERKGQENLKHDLIRRIKMLEYALKQERAKFHRLKYGTADVQQEDIKPPAGLYDEPGESGVTIDSETPYSAVSNITWKQGRQLLRQYLQEIGYTDTIIDVRSNRVRSLLGLNNNTETEENLTNTTGPVNGNEASNKRANENQGRQTPAKKSQPASLTEAMQRHNREAMMLETEAAIMANFEYLGHDDVEMDDEDMGDDLEDQQDDDQDDIKSAKHKSKALFDNNDVDPEVEEVLNEFSLITESAGDSSDLDSFAKGFPSHRPMKDEDLDCTLGLGELAQLTVNNDAEASYDVGATKEAFRKTWNAKYTLRSHFDCVRALAFHPVEPVLITASEDNTLKLWNLQKTVFAKKSASLDVEPLYTFRCHTGPVLSVAMSTTGEHCYSGGFDGAIHCWTLPSPNVDPYDSFDPEVLTQTLSGHYNAVWGLRVHSSKPHLLSCSADGTVKLWAPHVKDTLLNTFKSEQDGSPTSVDFVRDEANHIVAAYNSSNCIIFDCETGKPVVRFENNQEGTNNTTTVNAGAEKSINRVICHPSLPLTITAHEDRHIRFYDNNTGKLVHAMVAHLDAVTSLAVDPNGLFLLSGSHDCSIRLWNLDNKTCVQEITAHRKKFDESILDVAFHPSSPYIASAGADGLAKVFV